MKSACKIAALSGAVLMLAGCAGIPTAVSVASMYVNSLLMLRTSKGVADHAVSAAMEQDCGFVNMMEHGAYCIDAPAPQLLAAMTADADMLTPAKPRTPTESAATAAAPREIAPLEIAQLDVVAAAPPAVEQPSRKPAPPPSSGTSSTTTAFVSPPPPAPAHSAGEGFLVVLASYRNPATAAAHAARLKRQAPVVTSVEVRGEAFHRVALRAASQSAAQRMLSQAKATGASGAWVIAGAAGGGKHPVGPADAPKPQRPTPAAPAYAAAPTAPLL